MSSETEKYGVQAESEPRHSALEEFSRDERRPAVLLMAGLLIASVFFAIGIMVGRWSIRGPVGSRPSAASSGATTNATPTPSPSNLLPGSQPSGASPNNVKTNQPARDTEHRFTVLVATYSTPEDAQPLVKSLEQAGYTDVRTSTPRANNTTPKFSVLVGRYTRDEARAATARLSASTDPKLKSPRVVEDNN
jgi:sporulation related protein